MNVAVYSRIAKVLSLFAVILVIAPFLYYLLFGGGMLGMFLSLCLPALCLAAGYFLQALFAKITGYSRDELDIGADKKVRYVDPAAAAFPTLVAFILYFLLKKGFIAILDYRGIPYDPYSLFLFIVPIALCLFCFTGIRFWFYPYYKILHAELLPIYGSLFALGFVVSLIYSAPCGFLAFCFALFLPIYLLVSNLRSIEQSLKASKFRVPDNGFRSYNFALTVKHVLITALAILVVYASASIIANTVEVKFSPVDEKKSEEKYTQSNDFVPVFQQKTTKFSEGLSLGDVYDEGADAGNSLFDIFWYVVIVGTFTGIVLRWLYKKHMLAKFFEMLRLVWQGFFDFMVSLFDALGKRGCQETDESVQSYVDTPSNIDYSVEYGEYKGCEFLSIKEFDRMMSEKEGIEERYAYAYSTYCNLMRSGDNGIKGSDTPRVLTAKLKAQRKADLERATPVYEDIRYRLIKPSISPCEDELKELVRLVHSLLKTV